jgi:glycosyltransferase involved in cell wall biosynthesis
LNIIHIITGLETGGAETTLYNLLCSSFGMKYNHHVISLSKIGTIGPKIRSLNVPVTALDISGVGSAVSGMKNLRRIVRELKPNLIQGWLSHGNLAATLARASAGKDTYLAWNTRHSLLNTKDSTFSTRQIIRLCKYLSAKPEICFYNSAMSKDQHESIGFSSKCAGVIPNGVDTETYKCSTLLKEKIRSEFGISQEAFVIGHVARAHPMKDHPSFLKATSAVARAHPDCHILLAGLDVEPGNNLIKRYIDSSVSTQFHLLGERNDVPELMSAMDMFCQSSWSEGFPNVLAEAMSACLPCVATNVGDTDFIIGNCGFVVEPYNERALISGIEKVLTMSKTERLALGKKSRERIEKEFTIEIMATKYTAAYEKILHR